MRYRDVKALVPVLELSAADCRGLARLGDELVEETVAQALALWDDAQGHVDHRRWKELRRKEDIRVYCERRAASTDNDSNNNSSSGGGGGGGGDALPPLLATGSVVGSLEDVMYAATTPTAGSMGVKTAYIHEGVVAAKVVHQLRGPTSAEPFRNLAVKWSVIHPPRAQGLVRPRDYLYLDATGVIASSPRGGGGGGGGMAPPVGYRITHSVAFPGFPDFEATHGLVRGNISVCCVYRARPSADGRVDCFVRGFFELRGGIPRRLALQAVGAQATSFTRQIYCAQMKKLAWRLRRCDRLRARAGANPDDDDDDGEGDNQRQHHHQQHQQSHDQHLCGVCNKKTGFALLASLTIKRCRLCQAPVCPNCRVKKRLFVLDGEDEVSHRDVTCCTPCVTETIAMDAEVIARDEFVRGLGHKPSRKWSSGESSDDDRPSSSHTRSLSDLTWSERGGSSIVLPTTPSLAYDGLLASGECAEEEQLSQ